MATSEEEFDKALYVTESIHHIHGKQCLCGFESAVSRDRTRHIIASTMDAIRPALTAVFEEGAQAQRDYDVAANLNKKGLDPETPVWGVGKFANPFEGLEP